MADLPVKTEFEVEVTPEVFEKWCDVKIQEKKSRIIRMKQDIEDLKAGQIVKLEGHLKMLELELQKLLRDKEQRNMKREQAENNNTITVEGGETNG